MKPQQEKPTPDTEVQISLADATIRSCSLDEGRLDITLTNNLRLQFRPTLLGVRRYLYVIESVHPANVPDNFVERIEQLLRDGQLGVPKLVDLG
jgi:hypothetical protein